MRHLRKWAVVWIAAAVLIGCGPGKELPDDDSKSKGSDRGPTEPKEVIPTTSDPVAKEIVDRAIKAHTLNNRSLLEKGKISKVTADGTFKIRVPPVTDEQVVPSKRTVIARWPEQVKLTQDLRALIPGTMTTIQNRSFSWWGHGSTPNPITNPQLFEEWMRTDVLGQHWLPLIFPLTESQGVVFEPQRGVNSPPEDTIRFSFPGRPIYRLHFAPSTGYLIRISYLHHDAAGLAMKEWLLSDHELFAGLMLPSKMMLARTPHTTKLREVVEEWTVVGWEFPEKIDDATFDPPK